MGIRLGERTPKWLIKGVDLTLGFTITDYQATPRTSGAQDRTAILQVQIGWHTVHKQPLVELQVAVRPVNKSIVSVASVF